jgi:hypothetical protein
LLGSVDRGTRSPSEPFVADEQLALCFCFGTAHLDLRLAICGLSSLNPGLGRFCTQSIFEPGEPQRENACGFLLLELSDKRASTMMRGPRGGYAARRLPLVLDVVLPFDVGFVSTTA